LAFCSDSLRGAVVEHTPREASVRLVTRWPCLALVAVFCLLALAASAHAEGTWMLWMMGASSPWDSVGTFPTREQCMEALHQQAQAVEKLGLKVTEDGPGGSFAGTDVDRDIRGQCLPDTIDPRDPKGK